MISLQDLYIQKVGNFATNTIQLINYNAVCMLINLTGGELENCSHLIDDIICPDEPHQPIIPKLNFLVSQKYLSSPGATDVIGQNHLNSILDLF